jgi:hypothetical protein
MPSFELLASECPPDVQCPKIVRRRAGLLTVVGTAVTDPSYLAALGVHGHEAAVDISEEMLREAYAALTGDAP